MLLTNAGFVHEFKGLLSCFSSHLTPECHQPGNYARSCFHFLQEKCLLKLPECGFKTFDK